MLLYVALGLDLVTLFALGATAGVVLYVHRNTQYLVGRQKLYDEWAVADRALQEQRRAPLHKLSPPKLHVNGRGQPTGNYTVACSCGWRSVAGEASSALDEAERHKAQMPVRRAV